MCVCNSRVRQRVSLDAVAPSREAIAALAARIELPILVW